MIIKLLYLANYYLLDELEKAAKALGSVGTSSLATPLNLEQMVAPLGFLMSLLPLCTIAFIAGRKLSYRYDNICITNYKFQN